MNNKKDDVREQTLQLQNYLHQFEEKFYEQEKPDLKDRTYFEYVRQNIDPMYDTVDKWEEDTLFLIKERIVKLHPQQIDATVKSLKAIALHSFYIDVRKKRYQDIKKSIEYIFQLLLKELE